VVIPVIHFADYTMNASVSDLDINGNEQNNRNWFTNGRGNSIPYGAHGIILQTGEAYIGHPKTASYCTLENLHIYDTIRSSIVVEGNHNLIENVVLGNSAADHQVYLDADATYNTMRNIICTGSSVYSSFKIGLDMTVPSQQYNLIENVHFVNLTRSAMGLTTTGSIEPVGNVWFPGTAMAAYDQPLPSYNTIKDIYFEETNDNSAAGIFISQNNTILENIHFTSKAGLNTTLSIYSIPTAVMMINASNCYLNDIYIKTTSAALGAPTYGESIVLVTGTGNKISNINIVESGSAQFAGLELYDSLMAINNTSVSHATINVRYQYLMLHGATSNHGIYNLLLQDFYEVSPLGTYKGVEKTGTVTYQNATLTP
jgi:hypothetical protein